METFKSIPPTIWVPVLSAVISIITALVTTYFVNRGHTRRLREQLTHDAIQRRQEREFSLQKEIYLAAVEAISAAQLAIARFADLRLSQDDVMQAYIDKSPAVAQAQLIVETTTLKKATSLMSEVTTVYLRLSQQRMVLVVQQGQVESLAREQDSLRDNLTQYFTRAETGDQAYQESVQRYCAAVQDRLTEIQQQLAALATDFVTKHFEYIETCSAEAIRIARLTVPTFLALRKELKFLVDEEEYTQILEDGFRKQEAVLREFLHATAQFARGGAPSASEGPAQ